MDFIQVLNTHNTPTGDSPLQPPPPTEVIVGGRWGRTVSAAERSSCSFWQKWSIGGERIPRYPVSAAAVLRVKWGQSQGRSQKLLLGETEHTGKENKGDYDKLKKRYPRSCPERSICASLGSGLCKRWLGP